MAKESSLQIFPIDLFIKGAYQKLIMLRRFYMNITGCVGIAGYRYDPIFIISLK